MRALGRVGRREEGREGGRKGGREGGAYLVDADDPVFRGEGFLECGELDVLDGDDLVAGPVEAGEGGREGGREEGRAGGKEGGRAGGK